MTKYIFTLYLIILLSNSVFSQTQIDDNISIKIPEKIQIFDTISNNTSVKAYFSKNENDSYIILKESKVLRKNEKNILDQDLKSLQNKYAQIIASQIDAMSKNGFIFKDSIQIKINNFIGYKIIYKEIDSENINAESEILFLNGSTYIISYSKVKEFSEINKNNFFNSLRINNPDELKQIEEKLTVATIMIQYVLPLVILVILVIYLKRRRNKNKSVNDRIS